MNLYEQINADLKSAMKEKNALVVSTIRMLMSAIKYETLNSGSSEVDDKCVLQHLKKQVKQRIDSIEQYSKAGRDDLKEKESLELEILEKYLPKQLSDENLRSITEETIRELGATDKKDFGRLIKAVIAKTSDRADGKRISAIVGELLPTPKLGG